MTQFLSLKLWFDFDILQVFEDKEFSLSLDDSMKSRPNYFYINTSEHLFLPTVHFIQTARFRKQNISKDFKENVAIIDYNFARFINLQLK